MAVPKKAPAIKTTRKPKGKPPGKRGPKPKAEPMERQQRRRKAAERIEAGEAPREPGRPLFVPDLKTVEQLSVMMATDNEIAGFIGCSRDTIDELKKRMPEYNEAVDRGRAKGKLNLRRKQYEAAIEGGNTTMMIWLGKQMLGQTDVVVTDNTHRAKSPIMVFEKPDET